MNLTCRQEHLARALHLASRMIGTRGTLPVLGNILLQTEKGRLKVAATDLELGVQTWVGGKIEKDGAITVPARLLVDFVVTTTDPTIQLSVAETTLHLQSEHYTANIKGIEASEFPLMPAVKRTGGITLKASDFKEAIGQTVFATAIDETRPVLTGVLLKLSEETVTLVATDSYRLAERKLPLANTAKPLNVIVPARALQEVARMLTSPNENIQLFISENQILFTSGETELISRLIDGIFPDYEQILPKETVTKVELQKQQFGEVMKMASFFARESANNVQLKVEDSKNEILVTAISPQVGDTISRLPAKVVGEAIEIAFNAKFILDALAVLPADGLELSLSGKLAPGILRAAGQSDYLYLIMPLRVEN